MLAAVPIRCMSIGVGSSRSASRCSRIPTWRCSRTACWAAMIEPVRPIRTGITMPGNSTVLRTGTMMSASAGSGGKLVAAPAGVLSVERVLSPGMPSSRALMITSSATARSSFGQSDEKAAIDTAPLHVAVAARGQAKPALEPAMRQLEPMNGGGQELWRQHAGAGDQEIAVLDRSHDVVGRNPGQCHQDEDGILGLQNVGRRLPG